MNNIYVDNAATTALRSEALEAMLPYLTLNYGNASSIHQLGRDARIEIERSRVIFAGILKCQPRELFFTSGGSESDNWAIKGIAIANLDKGKHIITSQIEHPAVIKTCKFLEQMGFNVTYLPVDNTGIISVEMLKKAILPGTILISIMAVNNEVGTIQPIDKIECIAKENGIYFHTDVH